jgi:hypothetical protein
MAMAVKEISQADKKELIRRLAEFRNGLEPLEQQLLDSIVKRAFETSDSSGVVPTGNGGTSEDDVAGLAAKLSAFEQPLPDEQRALLDALLAKGSHDEPEVEGHIYAAWSTSDWIWNFDYYTELCVVNGGIGVTASPYWWQPGYSQFTCWRW